MSDDNKAKVRALLARHYFGTLRGQYRCRPETTRLETDHRSERANPEAPSPETSFVQSKERAAAFPLKLTPASVFPRFSKKTSDFGVVSFNGTGKRTTAFNWLGFGRNLTRATFLLFLL